MGIANTGIVDRTWKGLYCDSLRPGGGRGLFRLEHGPVDAVAQRPLCGRARP